MLAPWKKSYDKPRQHIKIRNITFLTKVHVVRAMVFPVVLYGCESWTMRKADHWRTDSFQLSCWRSFESSLDSREIKPVNPKGNQPWIFIGRTDAEAEAPILWPPDAKNWLIRKDPDAGKDWGQDKKGETEDEMVGWHHCLNGHEFEQAPGDGKELGSLACCSPWGCKESDMTEQLNNNNTLKCWRLWMKQIQYSELCYHSSWEVGCKSPPLNLGKSLWFDWTLNVEESGVW